jgi:nitroreductase
MQECRYVVVTDKAKKEQLSATRAGRPPGPPPNPNSPTAPAPMPPMAQPLIEAPVVIAVCAELNKSGVRPDGSFTTDKGANWYMYDAGLATENLCLAAHALGLGTVIIGAFDARKAGEILKVPQGFAVVALVPIGHPAAPGRPTNRRELAEIVSYNEFGKGKASSSGHNRLKPVSTGG